MNRFTLLADASEDDPPSSSLTTPFAPNRRSLATATFRRSLGRDRGHGIRAPRVHCFPLGEPAIPFQTEEELKHLLTELMHQVIAAEVNDVEDGAGADQLKHLQNRIYFIGRHLLA
jgi:hypothetical protein